MYSENVLKLICYLERKKGEEEGKYIDCFSKHLTYQHPEYIISLVTILVTRRLINFCKWYIPAF